MIVLYGKSYGRGGGCQKQLTSPIIEQLDILSKNKRTCQYYDYSGVSLTRIFVRITRTLKKVLLSGLI
jgi:hypothetical protein